ncbi:MAG: substrate-binding domain-containing protein [Pseudomonadota bacterium]
MFRSLTFGLLVILGPTFGFAAERLLIQSTTSTHNSGLYDHVLPLFEAATGIKARVVAVGTGQALRNAQNCDGDVLVVHSRVAEDAFVNAGYGSERRDLMYNDFVIIGPSADPLSLAGLSLDAAMTRLGDGLDRFVSRGDDSGTHRRERALWMDNMPAAQEDKWYLETGAGMGATLNIAVGLNGYTLSDRATWVAFQNKLDHRILVEGDPALTNPYGIIPVSPDHCPRVAAAEADAFVDWFTGEPGQAAISAFRVDGQQLFFPGAPSL